MAKHTARTKQRNLSREFGGYGFLCLELLGGPGTTFFVRFVLLRDI